MIPIALTVAGSDPSGGAGVQADLKTFAALGVYGASVITSLTAQNTRGVQGIHDVPALFVTQQLDSILADLTVRAVKIGMLSRAEVVAAVAAGLARRPIESVVLDPVMVATSGDRLIDEDAIAAVKALLIPRALLITPNLPEAAALLDEAAAEDEAGMARQGERLLALGPGAVLVKGGHAGGPESVDLLVDASGVRRFAGRRHETRNLHGTGCTLSAAIAAGLAKGMDTGQAVQRAKDYVGAAIAASDRLQVGSGNGPLHHFHALWP